MQTKEIKRICKMLKDISPFSPKPHEVFKFVNISTGNYDPPAYIVEILLLVILELKNYGRMEKVLWHTYFKYKDFPFMIRDYKFGTWTIEGLRKDNGTVQLTAEIKSKIIKASKILDKILHKELKSMVEKEKFFINNVFYKLLAIYEFYEKKTLNTIKNYERFEKLLKKDPKKISMVAEILNKKTDYEKAISNYTFSLILSFFSCLEFLLDVIYAFEQPNIGFLEFRKQRWDDRFKLIFPINKNKILKQMYDNFVEIRRNYRNPLSHGLANELNLLVPLSKLGLVPTSYKYLANKTYYGFIEINKEETLKIIRYFREFLNHLKNENPYGFYMLYLSFGFPIPINSKDISELKQKMTTYKDYKKYLDERAAVEDRIINRDF